MRAETVIGFLALNDSEGLLVDIRNVSNWGVQFNANQEPILAFGIVPIAVKDSRCWQADVQ
jgi:hypothetical protein